MAQVFAVIPAAGIGARLGAPIPKAFVELEGKTLLERAYEGLVAAGVDLVVIVASADMHEAARLMCPGATLVEGGRERVDSVRCGVEALPAASTQDDSEAIVLVHDAARALTPVEMVRSLCTVPVGVDCVVPVLPVSDTIKQVDADGKVLATPQRKDLRAVQTPQACRLSSLRAAYAALDDSSFEPTDDASLIEWWGGVVTTIPGDERALKITHPIDLVIAKHYLSAD